MGALARAQMSALRERLFKQAVRGLIPDQIIDRPKQGFSVPVNEWLHTRLGTLIDGKLSGFAARTDYFDPNAIRSLIGRRDYLTWYLLNFVLWHEMWIESSNTVLSGPPTLEAMGLG